MLGQIFRRFHLKRLWSSRICFSSSIPFRLSPSIFFIEK